MKILYCKCGKQILVDDEDYYKVSSFTWSCLGGSIVSTTLHHTVDGKRTSLTKGIAYFIIDIPEGFEVDHIDRDIHDNTKRNLRKANKAQQAWNRGLNANSSSGLRGVNWHADKWEVRICKNGKRIHIGRYSSKVEAAKAYNAAATRLFGEFAYQNPIPTES